MVIKICLPVEHLAAAVDSGGNLWVSKLAK